MSAAALLCFLLLLRAREFDTSTDTGTRARLYTDSRTHARTQSRTLRNGHSCTCTLLHIFFFALICSVSRLSSLNYARAFRISLACWFSYWLLHTYTYECMCGMSASVRMYVCFCQNVRSLLTKANQKIKKTKKYLII